MGKNTMMKRSIRLYCETTGDEKWLPLLEELVGNVGLVFTLGDLSDVRTEIDKYQVGAPARVGLVAPEDVKVPAGGTGMDPSQTSFFQVGGAKGLTGSRRAQRCGAPVCPLHRKRLRRRGQGNSAAATGA